MSLLDRGKEDIVVYPEEVTIDPDGNIFTRPSETGIPARATIQAKHQSGTSSRRVEQDEEGFESEEVYRVRFPRSFSMELGPQSRIEWNGQYWALLGQPVKYNGSPRTRHSDYTIRRS